MKPRPLAVLARTRPYSLILARARSCSPCPVREQAGTEFMDYLKKIVSDQAPPHATHTHLHTPLHTSPHLSLSTPLPLHTYTSIRHRPRHTHTHTHTHTSTPPPLHTSPHLSTPSLSSPHSPGPGLALSRQPRPSATPLRVRRRTSPPRSTLSATRTSSPSRLGRGSSRRPESTLSCPRVYPLDSTGLSERQPAAHTLAAALPTPRTFGFARS